MIVDSALTDGQWAIVEACRAGDVDPMCDLPDEVLAHLHRAEQLTKAAGGADHLKAYWAHGAGAGKIGWGTKGDFARCVSHVGKYMDSPEGYCNLRHKEATGQYPAQHAASMKGKVHKNAVTVVEKFNPNHDGHGRFATHSGMRVGETKNDEKAQANLTDDATHFDRLPPEMQAGILSSQASFGATPAILDANIEATLDRAIARTGNPPQGHQWYEQANAQAAMVAADTGMHTTQVTGAIAAISPQMAWGPNLAVARYAAENQHTTIDMGALGVVSSRKGIPGEKTAYEWAKAEVDGRKIDGVTRVMPPLSALQGKTFHDLDPYVAASLMKAHAQAGAGVFEGKRLKGPLSIADDITGKVSKVNFPPTIQTGRGLRIYRGEDANLILNGHKVRSFRNNLTNPLDPHGDVTVDSHAMSLALGRKVSSSSFEYGSFGGSKVKVKGVPSPYPAAPSNATLGVKGAYSMYADSYRRVAAKRGLRVQQLQSITWIQWRHEHPDNARTSTEMDAK